jgi:DNA-binding protein HU-beta
MNKSDLISKIASDAGITKAQAQTALNSFTDATAAALKGGDKVILVGFGTFSISERAARTGRNPQTGKAINIAAKKVVRFKAGTELSNNVG